MWDASVTEKNLRYVFMKGAASRMSESYWTSGGVLLRHHTLLSWIMGHFEGPIYAPVVIDVAEAVLPRHVCPDLATLESDLEKLVAEGLLAHE